ncbi:MAG: hypothetical protein HQ557_11925 [Bacteroidetes bacterium]|nr:hypothetical protein [Bacteroidota bacterium]
MIGYIEGTPSQQIGLFNTSLDELIGTDSIVRFIDAYVESLERIRSSRRLENKNTEFHTACMVGSR